jgi:uncharacterized protein
MIRIYPILLLFLFSLCSSMAQTSIEGPWHGAVDVQGSVLRFNIEITRSGDSLAATLDIPEQKGFGLPLQNVQRNGDSISFELPAGPGTARFAGIVRADSISGSFQQGAIVGVFGLRRGRYVEEKKVEAPLPYLEEEVTFSNGNVTLAGTLTLPKGKGPFPAVMLISGSGAQNRDEELFGFRPFRVIADHLTRNGIAVLRYDDRGVGGSTGDVSTSTTEDFGGDVLSGVAFLKKHKSINRKKIGLLGHSEGGIIAPMVASRSNDVAFIILMAGSGIRGEELLYAQGIEIAKAAGATQEQIEQQTDSQRRVFAAVRRGKLDSLKTVLLAEARAYPGLTPEQSAQVEQMIDQQLAGAASPWFGYFLSLDPAVALRKVRVPTLMLFGALDRQVPAELNRAAMEKALSEGGNKKYQTVIFPTANHLFIEAKTGGPDEYATAKKELVPGLLKTITDFVKKQ